MNVFDIGTAAIFKMSVFFYLAKHSQDDLVFFYDIMFKDNSHTNCQRIFPLFHS